MRLGRPYEGIEIHRNDKILYLYFHSPHRVLSSSRGHCAGMRDDLRYLYNHQCCEPAGHVFPLYDVAVRDPRSYQGIICDRHGLPPDESAGLTTAANMNNAAIVKRAFEDLVVVAAATGGVHSNAARAGDPAVYHQKAGSTVRLNKAAGTVNVMVCANAELSPGAMVQAVITATEAKSAVLQELGVPSRQSDGYATGTGTDQIGIASLLCSEKLTDAGKHSKLGELIGATVHDAVRDTLKLQNGLYPEGRCSVLGHIERLGVSEESMVRGVSERLSADEAALFERNFLCVDRDPLTVAAVAALVHLLDKCVWGVLPTGCFAEMALPYAAQLAVAVAGEAAHRSRYEEELSAGSIRPENEQLVSLIFDAISAGFSDRWGWQSVEPGSSQP